MWCKLVLGELLLVSILAAPSAAQKYTDPDLPEVEAAAIQALAHGVILPVSGRILDIIGISRGIDGLLKELGAQVTEMEVRIDLSADVLFDFDMWKILPAAAVELDKVGEVIRAYPRAPLVIEGYTDSKGSDEYNLELSSKRAASVKAWLVGNAGINAGQISTQGRGESQPVAPNTYPDGSDNPEGRQQNRRVSITIQTAQKG